MNIVAVVIILALAIGSIAFGALLYEEKFFKWASKSWHRKGQKPTDIELLKQRKQRAGYLIGSGIIYLVILIWGLSNI